MFRAVVLAPEPEFGKAVERLAFETQHLTVNKTMTSLPENGYEIGRLISSYDPEIILLQNTNVDQGLQVAERLRTCAPEVALVALGGRMAAQMEQQFEAMGAVVLNGAFSQHDFVTSLKKAIHRARQDASCPLYAFLPGKAGSGATTVAFNLSTAMAISHQKRVFVLEADLHSGVMSVLIDRKPRRPLIDVLQNSDSLDYSQWLNLVVTAHSTDFMLADRVKKSPLPSWMHYHQLLRFASGRYDTIVVDLPEVVNEASDEIVQYARLTFVVCTPELTSLKLAEQRLAELKSRGAPADRLRVVLNRWHRSDMKPEEVANLLGSPVSFVIKNDYRSVAKAIASSQPVAADSELGKSFIDFGEKLAGSTKKVAAKGRFSFFS